jgi:oxygen-independent coproporphyrinogen-3 oxidase
MSTSIEFREKLTNFYRYPKICKFQDEVEDKAHIVSYLKQPHPGEKLVYIYIHIPWCTSMCNYCPFHHTYYHHTDDDTKRRFVEAIVKELGKYAASPFFQTQPVVNINFGGGTPFLLDIKYIERILTTVYDKFKLAPDPVVSIEGDPIALQDRQKLKALKGLGVTRASFGLQTFNERLRRKLTVESTGADVYKCVESLRYSGYEEWGCDMLYNCPEQNVTEVKFNVDRICELGPSIIDVYDLNISPNTQLAKLVIDGKFSSNPSNQNEIEQFRAIKETFEEHGFEQVRSVNFKPPWAETKRNGILHQFSEDVLGIGPSARTFLYSAGRNYRNHCTTEKYIEDLERDEFPIEAGNVVPERVLEERDMVLFPYYMEVRKDSINYSRFKEKIDDLVLNGYVSDLGDSIQLTEKGRLWAGNVQYYFHSEEEKVAIATSTFLSLQRGTNLFNQDYTNVRRVARSA